MSVERGGDDGGLQAAGGKEHRHVRHRNQVAISREREEHDMTIVRHC